MGRIKGLDLGSPPLAALGGGGNPTVLGLRVKVWGRVNQLFYTDCGLV